MSTTRTTQLYIHRESIPLSCSESQLLLHHQRWAQTLGANIQLMYEYIFNPGGHEQTRIVQTNIHLQMYSLDLSLSQIKCQTHLLISSFKQLVSTSCQHLVTYMAGIGRVSYGPFLHRPLHSSELQLYVLHCQWRAAIFCVRPDVSPCLVPHLSQLQKQLFQPCNQTYFFTYPNETNISDHIWKFTLILLSENCVLKTGVFQAKSEYKFIVVKMGVLSCPLKFSFGECQRWSKSHLCCRGKEKAEIFVWKSNLVEKVGAAAGDGYLFENPILMQQQQQPPKGSKWTAAHWRNIRKPLQPWFVFPF